MRMVMILMSIEYFDGLPLGYRVRENVGEREREKVGEGAKERRVSEHAKDPTGFKLDCQEPCRRGGKIWP